MLDDLKGNRKYNLISGAFLFHWPQFMMLGELK